MGNHKINNGTCDRHKKKLGRDGKRAQQWLHCWCFTLGFTYFSRSSKEIEAPGLQNGNFSLQMGYKNAKTWYNSRVFTWLILTNNLRLLTFGNLAWPARDRHCSAAKNHARLCYSKQNFLLDLEKKSDWERVTPWNFGWMHAVDIYAWSSDLPKSPAFIHSEPKLEIPGYSPDLPWNLHSFYEKKRGGGNLTYFRTLFKPLILF